MKRYTITGCPGTPERKVRRASQPATLPRVRIHLTPAGVPWEVFTPGELRSMAEDLERAAVWLEAQPTTAVVA